MMNTRNSSQSKGACGKAAFYHQNFNFYTEKIFNESDELSGCVVGGENINNLRYADDTALLVESESTVQSIVVDVVRQNSDENGLSQWWPPSVSQDYGFAPGFLNNIFDD